MGRKRKFGRALNGVVVIDKAAGMTSNDVVQQAKKLFFANKAGHTGSLDPLATGVLPICFGEATKFSQFLLDADKAYESTFCFGAVTTTADADGELLATQDASALSANRVERALALYRGDISQVPPMYSALKKDGQPLYKLARQGIEVEREARPVFIYRYELLDFVPGVQARARVLVACSKGTYIRVLAEDLGRDLGVGAHVESLRRIQAGNFDLSRAVSLETLRQERGEGLAECLDHHLLPMDAPVATMARIALDSDSAYYFGRGQAVMVAKVYALGDEGDKVRVFREDGEFLGVGEIDDDGRVAPRRLVASGEN